MPSRPDDNGQVRSQILLRVAAMALAAPLAYALIEPYRIVVRHFDVAFEGLPVAADGLRIAHLSDLHCSAITPVSLIEQAVRLCNEQTPDVVVLTGDYISRRNSYLPLTLARVWARPELYYAEQVAGALSGLQANSGVFAVPGNHDHAYGNYPAIAELLARAGVASLINANVRVRDLALVGLDDLRSGRPDCRRAFAGVDNDEAQVVLSHNPRVLPLVAQRNCLVLAGHTHSGQVHLPGLSFRRTPNDMDRTPFDGGWFSDNRARLFVSAGIGSVHFPMRFCCPPEVVVITLRNQT